MELTSGNTTNILMFLRAQGTLETHAKTTTFATTRAMKRNDLLSKAEQCHLLTEDSNKCDEMSKCLHGQCTRQQ